MSFTGLPDSFIMALCRAATMYACEAEMTELKTIKPVMIVSSPGRERPQASHRLVVIVPAGEVDVPAFAQRVWELARSTGAEVRLLSLCDDATQEPSQRRRLATMSAMIKSDQVHAKAEIVPGSDWIEAVRPGLEPGDMLVCVNEPGAGSMRKPLRQIIESNLNVPVTILSGLSPEERAHPTWAAQILGWSGSLGILAAFFWLQARLVQMPKDPAYMLLMLLTVPVEVWLIWLWNSLFG